MRRTSVLVTLATAAVAVGLAVPALATPQPPTPASLADLGGSGQPVIDWNRRLIAILGTPDAQPATVHPTRSFAMLQAAEYDAVVSITHGAAPYGTAVPAPDGARPDAAAEQAAHDVLVDLYPGKRADLDAQLGAELAGIPDGQAKTDGIAVGAATAQQVAPVTGRRRRRPRSSPAPRRATTGRHPRSRPPRCIPGGVRSRRSC